MCAQDVEKPQYLRDKGWKEGDAEKVHQWVQANVVVVPYGSAYGDLIGFLERLGAAAKEAALQRSMLFRYHFADGTRVANKPLVRISRGQETDSKHSNIPLYEVLNRGQGPHC